MEKPVFYIKFFLSRNFSALKHSNFRVFWALQAISLIGSWMQTISLPWLAYTMTESALFVGIIGALQFLPTIFFSLFAGVIIDRFNKRKLMLMTQSLMAIFAFILSLLVISDMTEPWHLVVITLLIGVANSLDLPSRQSLMIELVGKSDLMNAIALNSSIFNLARILGPAIAGVLMSLVGIGFCFLINSLSFIPVIISLAFFIKPAFSYFRNEKKHILTDIADGLKYIKNDSLLLFTFISVVIMGTFAMNFMVLVPVFAQEILKVEEAKFGLLMSFMGIGSFSGSLIIASISKKGPSEKFLMICSFILPVFILLNGISVHYFMSAILLGCAGIFAVMFFTTANSLIQLNSKDEFRGRVISVYTLLSVGSAPLGNFLTGLISQKMGARSGFIMNALVIILLISAFFIIKTLILKKK